MNRHENKDNENDYETVRADSSRSDGVWRRCDGGFGGELVRMLPSVPLG